MLKVFEQRKFFLVIDKLTLPKVRGGFAIENPPEDIPATCIIVEKNSLGKLLYAVGKRIYFVHHFKIIHVNN